MKFLKRCWAEVHLDAIANNVKEIKKLVHADCKVMAIVKANGYGHGLIPSAKACAEGGATWFGVATVDEAVQLRKGKLNEPTLVLGITPMDWVDELIELDIDQTVADYSYAKQLSDCAISAGKSITVHIKVDTGMNRLGISICDDELSDAIREIKLIYELPGLRVRGIYTHLSSSRAPNEESIQYTNMQLDLFSKICDEVKSEGLDIELRHCLNSAGILNYPQYAMDMVRAGHTLYENILKFIPGPKPAIQNAMDLFATIVSIKTLPPGCKIGYSRQYTLDRTTKLAVVGMGYADGYNRSLSNRGEVLVHGQRVKVLGSVCMDLFMIDVTDINNVEVGDIVTLAGQDGDERISMYNIMVQSGVALNPPAICLTSRTPIVYKRNGVVVGGTQNVQNYFWNEDEELK